MWTKKETERVKTGQSKEEERKDGKTRKND